MKKIKAIIKEINTKPYIQSIVVDIDSLQKFFVGNVEISCWLTEDIVILASADEKSPFNTATVATLNEKTVNIRGNFIIVKMQELFKFTSLTPKEIDYCFKLLNHATTSSSTDVVFV